MKKFHILTSFPNILDSYINESILKRAQKNKKIKISIHDIRKYSDNKHKNIDDKPYGGGPGMIFNIEPIHTCLKKLKLFPSKKSKKIIFLSPRGKKFNQKKAKELLKYDTIIFIAGRYEGVDERVKLYIADETISIGDYILSGGELPAIVIVETISRLIPGVIGKNESVTKKDHPQYTKPEKYFPKKLSKKSWNVPKILLSGNHKKINEWRKN